ITTDEGVQPGDTCQRGLWRHQPELCLFAQRIFHIGLDADLDFNLTKIVAFTMGPAAFYFGAAVILTILAVEWLDSRLLWDAHESGNARFDD
ncbi:paraquat-inducible protein A, partial [Escherichia coli]|uniref:paraquat-inducible protein A n=1 Tax=Escherichia coli TaxID=562 RepID=UPI002019AA21